MTLRLCLLILLSASGCTTLSEIAIDSKQLVQESHLFSRGDSARTSGWVMSRGAQFYIARNNQLTTLNSANSDVLTNTIQRAIADSFPVSYVAMLPESYRQALARASSLRADFLVYPSISSWDDRVGLATELVSRFSDVANSEISPKFGLDRAQVQLMIVHANSGAVFDVIKLKASSGLLSPYNKSPESILLPELRTLFSSLLATAVGNCC